MSGRDPYNPIKFENDFTLTGFKPEQRKSYDKPTHIAQTEDPWSRLYNTATMASSQRTVSNNERQEISSMVPKDSLDLKLTSVYDHHRSVFWKKNQIVYQKETIRK